MVQKRVFIDGRPLWVGVYHEDSGEWVAVANAGGELLVETGASESGALERWRESAIAILYSRYQSAGLRPSLE